MRRLMFLFLLSVGLVFTLGCEDKKEEAAPTIPQDAPVQTDPDPLDPSPAPTPEEVNHWEEIGLTSETLEQVYIDAVNCSSQERNFLSCIFALNAILSVLPDGPEVLLPPNVEVGISDFSTLQPTAVDLGSLPNEESELLAIVSSRVTEVSKEFPRSKVFKVNSESFNIEDPEARFTADREFRLAVIQLWKNYFNRMRPALFYSDIFDWIEEKLADEESKTPYWVVGLNSYLTMAFDDHTSVQPKANFTRTLESTSEEVFGGIGAVLQKEENQEYVVIVELIEGGPAEQAGMLPFDEVLEINGESALGFSTSQVANLMRGLVDTVVNVRVRRNGEEVDLQITRAQVVVPLVSADVVDWDRSRVGVMKLGSFGSQNSCEAVKEAVQTLSAQGVEGLVLDLRNNPGGLLDQAVCIADIFIEQDQIVTVQQYVSPQFVRARPETECDVERAQCTWKTRSPALTDLPLIVLLNARSASASELVAGALAVANRAYLVGEDSFGKGTFQTVLPFPSIADVMISLTMGLFFQADGKSNQLSGVPVDLEVGMFPETDLTRFVMREPQVTINPLPNNLPRTEREIDPLLRSCFETNMMLRNQYRSRSVDKSYDYQMLAAGDALSCQQSTELGGQQ